MASTQAVAKQLADDGTVEGTTVVAGRQISGRGRLGNSFFSPPGGLYCSIVLRPKLSPIQAPVIGLAAGLALAEAVRDVTGLLPVLKWPNDLLLRGRKLSGVLVDLASSGGVTRHVILGLGVNVNTAAQDFPAELREMATSLRIELSRETPTEDVLDALLARLSHRYQQLLTAGAAELLDAWRAWPNILGSHVRVGSPEQPWEGTAEDLDAQGALLVRQADGALRRAVAGNVHLLR